MKSNSGSITNQIEQGSLNQEEAVSLIIDRARELVKRLVEERGHEQPPFLAEEFARLQGIKRIAKANLGETSATLLRSRDGYVIQVNGSHNLARQNFSCAHEIGHILFNELKLEQYLKNIEYRTFNPQACAGVRAAARERLCDAAAKELLMPDFIFGKYLSGYGLSVHSIELLANIFKVSIQAVAIRIAEVSVGPCLALVWRPSLKTGSNGFRLAWCVGPGEKSLAKGYYVPLQTNVRPPSALHKAYNGNGIIKSFKDFKIGDNRTRLPMESKGFGRNEKRYVISLAFLNRI